MSYMVYADGFAAWSASSLPGAQELAEGYVPSGQALRIVSYSQTGDRAWRYERGAGWIEEMASAGECPRDGLASPRAVLYA